MHLIMSHRLVHLQVPYMILNLIFCSRFLILPVRATAFCDLGRVAGTLAGEDQGKKSLSALDISMSWVTRSNVFLFLLERIHIFLCLPFTPYASTDAFHVALNVSVQI